MQELNEYPTITAVAAALADVFDAMVQKYPVEYEGVKYGCISAITVRNRMSHMNALGRTILQVELMSKNGYVVIAEPQKIRILKGERNEKVLL